MKRTTTFLFGFILCLTIQAQSTYKGKLGYGLSPIGHPHDFSQFAVFLEEVASTCGGGVAFANGEWRDSRATSGKIPGLHKTVSLLQPSPYAYTDMLTFGWRSGSILHLDAPEDSTNNWSNESTKSLFLNMLINVADSLRPTYLFVGNETSRYWELDSADYLNWVSFYHEAYDSIKVHSPATKVGTVFNYEHLSGQGALTGFTTSYWQAFDAHDTSKIDILGLTVYPFFHDSMANDIPDTYLDPVFSRLGNKPLAITETGWPADSFIGGWTSSPGQQIDYVNKLFNIIEDKNVEVVNWLFLHYLLDTANTDADKIFRSVSLRDSLGADLPALPIWLSKCPPLLSTNTALQNNISHSFSLFPNPAKAHFTINHTQRIRTISIYNIRGEEVIIADEINSRQANLPSEDLASGLYLCIVENESGEVFSKKFVVE